MDNGEAIFTARVETDPGTIKPEDYIVTLSTAGVVQWTTASTAVLTNGLEVDRSTITRAWTYIDVRLHQRWMVSVEKWGRTSYDLFDVRSVDCLPSRNMHHSAIPRLLKGVVAVLVPVNRNPMGWLLLSTDGSIKMDQGDNATPRQLHELVHEDIRDD